MQMEAAKKTYHMACKEEKLAATREANGKTEASVTADQQKKLHEKVDKCKQDVQKVRKGRQSQKHTINQSRSMHKNRLNHNCVKNTWWLCYLAGAGPVSWQMMMNQLYF